MKIYKEFGEMVPMYSHILESTELNSSEKLLLSLLMRIDKEKSYYYTTINSLSEWIGVSTQTIKRILKSLENKELIPVHKDPWNCIYINWHKDNIQFLI